MPEEDARTVISSQTGSHAEVAADPADDWLSDASDLDWFDDPGRAPRPRAALQAGTVAAAASHEGPPPVDDVIRRRRAIALLAGLAVIVAVVLVWLLVIDSGGSNTPAPTTPVTTPANTTPAESTTPATTTTTTPATTTTTTPATGGTITVTLPAAGKMKPGDTSPEVKTLQEALNQLGTAQLKVDGIYGPLTQQAVTAFQQANGLTVDGIVGTQTSAALNTALAAQG